jgi:hypothetical protein
LSPQTHPATDRDRRRQTETGGDRQRQVETDRDRQGQTGTDRDEKRQTETDTITAETSRRVQSVCGRRRRMPVLLRRRGCLFTTSESTRSP